MPAPRVIAPPEASNLPERYAPGLALPSYRYVPGFAPHPTADPEGHSHGQPEVDAVHFPPERWFADEVYLAGVDLFNRRYYWEAHEMWEAVWRACDKSSTQGLFVQGLIQISAALLRWHMGTERGTRKLYQEGRAKLELVLPTAPEGYLGIPVAAWLGELEKIFARLLEWPEETPPLPVIRLLQPR
jgi:hypothetical protein